MGTAAGSALALALLVCGCVFAALAGPALSLHTRTQALHQTLAGFANTTKTVQVTAAWGDFTGSLQVSPARAAPDQRAPPADQRRRPRPAGDAAPARGRRLGQPEHEPDPRRGRRGGPAPRPGRRPSWRSPTAPRSPATRSWWRARSAARAVPPGAVGVAATTQTAARFGLHPGSRLTLAAPSGPVTLFVTAIVRQRNPGSTFWQQDTTLAKPSLQLAEQHIAALLDRRGHRGPGPVRRDPERVRRHRPRAAAGVPARRRRRERGPGPGAVRRR